MEEQNSVPRQQQPTFASLRVKNIAPELQPVLNVSAASFRTCVCCAAVVAAENGYLMSRAQVDSRAEGIVGLALHSVEAASEEREKGRKDQRDAGECSVQDARQVGEIGFTISVSS